MAKKCPECNSCLDIIWIMPRRFFHCWLCDIYYDVINNSVTKINLNDVIMNKQIINKIEEEINGRSSS